MYLLNQRVMADFRNSYRYDNNTVISFFNECLEERPSGKIKDGCTTGKVYDVYKAWCLDNNHGYSKTAKEFREELSEYLSSTLFRTLLLEEVKAVASLRTSHLLMKLKKPTRELMDMILMSFSRMLDKNSLITTNLKILVTGVTA
jgi:phage/plasmid-associated DNA primase